MPLKTRLEESPTSATATIAGRRIALPIRDAPWPLRSMTRAHIKELEYVSLLNGRGGQTRRCLPRASEVEDNANRANIGITRTSESLERLQVTKRKTPDSRTEHLSGNSGSDERYSFFSVNTPVLSLVCAIAFFLSLFQHRYGFTCLEFCYGWPLASVLCLVLCWERKSAFDWCPLSWDLDLVCIRILFI